MVIILFCFRMGTGGGSFYYYMYFDILFFRIGTGEKGFLTLKLYVKGEAGHSSMPLKETAIGILAGAVARYCCLVWGGGSWN